MDDFRKVTIVGAGWLGKALGRHLAGLGWEVSGTTTSPERFPELEAADLRPLRAELTPDGLSGDTEAIFASPILVLAFPPNLRSGPAGNYLARIHALLEVLPEGKKILMVSSTGVLPDADRIVTEADADHPDTDRGREMRSAEKALMEAPSQQATVIRFGGLVGPERNPVKYFAGKTDLPKGNHPVNLIHQEDCVEIMTLILEAQIWGRTFNACAPEHPTHREYYPAEAKRRGLAVPEYRSEDTPGWKIVSVEALEKELGYEFLCPDPMEFPLD